MADDQTAAETQDLSQDFLTIGKEALAKELAPLRDYAARAGRAELTVVSNAIEAVTSRLLVHVVGALHPTGLDALVVKAADAKAAEAQAQAAADATNETVSAVDAPQPVVEAAEAAVDPVLEKVNAEVEALTGAGQ